MYDNFVNISRSKDQIITLISNSFVRLCRDEVGWQLKGIIPLCSLSYAGLTERKPMVNLPSLREMLDNGVHFGHKTSRWHPKMASYIFMAKNGVSVINLEKTEEELKKAADYVRTIAAEGKTIVFVGSKKQAQELVKKAALNCGMPYVNVRWVGGTLTNFETVKVAIKKFKDQKEQLAMEATSKLSKKELSKLREVTEKGEKLFGGLVNLEKKPDAMILLGAHDEKNALREANLEKIPVIAMVDTNMDPSSIEYPIPANDDATKSIELFANLFSRIIKENKGLARAKEEK